MGVASPPPAGRRPCSILFTVQGVFNREELLSEEEFCIQPDGHGISAPGREESLLCSNLFTVQGVFNGEELRRSSVSSLMGVAAPPPAERRRWSALICSLFRESLTGRSC